MFPGQDSKPFEGKLERKMCWRGVGHNVSLLLHITLMWMSVIVEMIKIYEGTLVTCPSSIRAAETPLYHTLDLETPRHFSSQNLFWLRSRTEIFQPWEYVKFQVWLREWDIKTHPVAWMVTREIMKMLDTVRTGLSSWLPTSKGRSCTLCMNCLVWNVKENSSYSVYLTGLM